MSQQRRLNWSAVLGLVGAMAWLGLAGCAGKPPAPAVPQAASSPDISQAWTVLSQNPRFAQTSPTNSPAPAGPQSMSPAEARLAAPFVFGLPGWVPPGFELQDQAEVIAPARRGDFASVSLTWQNAQDATIELLISQGEASADLAGAGANSESLQIGGQPASLRHQTGLGGADRLVLAWASGSLSYRLTAESGAATRDELVRMAASIS